MLRPVLWVLLGLELQANSVPGTGLSASVGRTTAMAGMCWTPGVITSGILLYESLDFTPPLAMSASTAKVTVNNDLLNLERRSCITVEEPLKKCCVRSTCR